MTRLRLTERALSDIDEIDRYSVEHFGRHVADRYLADLGEALSRLEADPSLFRDRHDYTGRLRFYRLREHVIVGDVIKGVTFVLTVWHGSMDFIERLSELEPDLRHEAEWMAAQIEADQG